MKPATDCLWKTYTPPKDGTMIVAIGNITEDFGDGEVSVEPFTESIYWNGQEWINCFGLSIAPSADAEVRILNWTNYPYQPAEMTGVYLIAAERDRQITEEGWTAEHDDTHAHAELVVASNQYSSFSAVQIRGNGEVKAPKCFVPFNWPWGREAWKPSDDPIHNLVKAGALIAAEIDRLLRLNSQNP